MALLSARLRVLGHDRDHTHRADSFGSEVVVTDTDVINVGATQSATSVQYLKYRSALLWPQTLLNAARDCELIDVRLGAAPGAKNQRKAFEPGCDFLLRKTKIGTLFGESGLQIKEC